MLKDFQCREGIGYQVLGIEVRKWKSFWVAILGPILTYATKFLLSDHFGDINIMQSILIQNGTVVS